MKTSVHILSVTGSDSSGLSGVQADIRAIEALGGVAATAITAVTVQTAEGIRHIHDLPPGVVAGQVRAVVESARPRAVKVGLVRVPETIRLLRDEIVGLRHTVLVPGIVSSRGERLMGDEAMSEYRRCLLPEAELLVVRCAEAELLLGSRIATDDDMSGAADALRAMGADAVMLRGGHVCDGEITALYSDGREERHFTSRNTLGWQRHGVGAALSAAIATRLGLGDTTAEAIEAAHDYVHSRVVYALSQATGGRPADIYNRFLALVAGHYRRSHRVADYARMLSITPRYLAEATARAVGKSPKQVIAEYLADEASRMLSTSRLTVQEVAARMGFTSQALFSTFYRSMTGRTPTATRADVQ